MRTVFFSILFCIFSFHFKNVIGVPTDIQRVIVEPFQHHDATKDYCLEAYEYFRDEQFSLQSLPVTSWGQANLFSNLDPSKSPEQWIPLFNQFIHSIRVLKKVHTEWNVTQHPLNLTLFLTYFEAFQVASEWESLTMQVEHTLASMPSCPTLLPGQPKWHCEPRWMYFRSLTTFSNIYCSQLDSLMQTLMLFFACQSKLPISSYQNYQPWFQAMKNIVVRTKKLHVLQANVLKLHSHGRTKFVLAHALLMVAGWMHSIQYDLAKLVQQLEQVELQLPFEVAMFLKDCLHSIEVHYQHQFQHRFQQLHAFEWILFKTSTSTRYESQECLAICMKSNLQCEQLVSPCHYRYAFHSVALAS